MKFVLGLTGQTGAGKSLLCDKARDNGFFVVDCDAVAHKVQQTEDVKIALCNVFGSDILSCDNIDRQRLAQKAFASKEQTELLNKTILPFIVDEIKNIISRAKEEYILLDAPTLFEGGADNLCDKVIGVIADREVRHNRIIARDNLTPDRAESRINAGKPDEFYKENCDFVLINNGSADEFINNFDILIKDILGGIKNG